MGRDATALRAVLFDAVGTLLHAEPCVAEVYAAVGRRHGAALSEAEIARRFSLAFAQQEALDRRWLAGRTSDERERRRWRRIVSRVFGPAARLEPIFAELWDHFGSASAWRLDPAAGHVWQQLSQAGCRLGVASNFDSRLLTICRAIPMLADCPRVFVSSEIGWKKPSDGYFQAIERKLGLSGEQILLVGDDLENDYLAAQSAGWRAVLLDPEQSRPDLSPIATLDELPARLGLS